MRLSEQTNENKTIIGCYQIENQTKLQASSDEGAVERSETEGVKKITSNYKELPQSFFINEK